MLKLTIKIIAIPFVLTLTIIHAFVKFLLFLSGKFFAIASLICGVGGAYTLFSGGNTVSGIALLAAAFLISPYGIPAIAQGLADLLDGMNNSLKGFIIG